MSRFRGVSIDKASIIILFNSRRIIWRYVRVLIASTHIIFNLVQTNKISKTLEFFEILRNFDKWSDSFVRNKYD